ncbi:beta-ketoacyl synthase chain length factor [Stenoxybacter acetivorans]|uniref:beta-ketoacyl synthase chain length factor n=1 Tax=Stenoxybacter acetivorans TaxID=422441 RepID=UPI0005633EE6|nr:beta-ketoacyl synthase chain length factor [Stenoxybacter acetivorans]
MIEVSFNLTAWRAVCPFFSERQDWQRWAQHPEWINGLPETKPNLDFLPPIQRRRLSGAARLMFAAAHPLLADNQHCPLVYASHDGEINRSFALWLSLLRGEGVSPTSFGLSVHNALPAQWSMLHQDMSEYTALSAEDHFEAAFTEACILLQEGAERVLLAVVDEPIASEYDLPQAQRAPFAYAFAAVLTAGDACRLRFQAAAETAEKAGDYWGALHWIRHVCLAEENKPAVLRQNYADRQWLWQWTR